MDDEWVRTTYNDLDPNPRRAAIYADESESYFNTFIVTRTLL
jgi:hypothetical protein